MCVYCKNRVLIIGLLLISSGVLTCGLALADRSLPHGSAMAVLVSIPLLGAVALGVLTTFAWVCELLDRRGDLRLPRPRAFKSQEPQQVVRPGGPSRGPPGQRQAAARTSLPLRPLAG
jgi:hypothetical protein